MKSFICAVWICVLCSCGVDTVSYPGGLKNPQSATLVTCQPYSDDSLSIPHSCLILSEPFLGRFMVFDASAEQFVLSPLGYLPLQIGYEKQNPLSGFISHFVKGISMVGLSAAMDVQHNRLLILRTLPSEEAKQVFGTPQSVSLPGQPLDAVWIPGNRPSIWLSTNEPLPKMARIFFDTKADIRVVDQIIEPVSMPVVSLSVEPDSKQVMRVFSNQLELYQIDQNGNLKRQTSIQHQFKSIQQTFLARMVLRSSSESVAVVLEQDLIGTRLKVFSFQSGLLAKKELDGPRTLYVSQDINRNPCGGDATWVLAMSPDGVGEYISVKRLLDKQSDQAVLSKLDLKTNQALGAKSQLTQLSTILGGSVVSPKTNCPNQRYLFIVFGTGVVVSGCEGASQAEDFRLLAR